MGQEQAPPPPPSPEQGHDWGASFSTDIYNPYYYGTDSDPIAHPSEITIYESIYLNSHLHWTFDISQI
jgi:hypothetical protein